ncbi:MAG: NAD-dependent epimerase/dehydratase family protein [Aggregatilineaceae bacterium]
MHVLITGGAGFIGSHTAKLLLAHGLHVTVLDNLSNGSRENLPLHSRLRLVVGDITDPAAVATALEGADCVLHLAAQVSVAASIEDPIRSCRDNLLGFITVLDSARRAGIQRFVYASSAAVYGQPVKLPLNEASSTAPTSPYGLEKLVNEQYAALYRKLHDLSLLGLRYFNVYGPGQDPKSPYSGVISEFVDRLRTGRPLIVHGDGLQTRDFVYVGDVATINLAALTGTAEGILNVGTGNSCTLLELIATLSRVTGITPQLSYAPARKGDIRHSAMSTTRLNQALGVVPSTPLEEGLSALWQHLESSSCVH